MNDLPLFSDNQNSFEQELKHNSLYNLVHPYSKYGLAVALFRLGRLIQSEEIENPTQKDLVKIFIQEIENGLNNFRFETLDNPETSDELRFNPIPLEKLRKDKSLVRQKGLADIGKYLAPTIVTTEGDTLGTFENAEKLIESLRNEDSLAKSSIKLSRSFAPTTQKINQRGNSSQSEPTSTLIEAVCSVITTLTETKPSAYVRKQVKPKEKHNSVIIPDLPLDELKDFVELFNAMLTTELADRGNPYSVEPYVDDKGKKSYKRPPIFNGNYPFAPRNSAFGAVGLLAAIGRWAVRAKEENWAERVLKSLEGKPLYVISYDNIFQVQFSHHVINLAIKDKLSTLIDELTLGTKLYSEIENEGKGKKRWNLTNYQLFDLMTNRFLQLFDKPSFQDFLAFRAEYALEVNTLFEEYFMKENPINREIVESARAYGQWLNLAAFIVANEETNSYSDMLKQKAKILIGFESAAMSGETPQDMLRRVSTQAGRLLQSEAPAEATKFIDAVMCGEVDADTAQQMLIAYMRLRTEKESN
ncbi:MAG: hypothetical protein ACR2MG_03140 [Pyrinomonadaceae bacterium]